MTMLSESEQQFASFDGTNIFYRVWLPADKARGAVVLLHRGHEHSGRWSEFVRTLESSNFAIFAWDARGHGKSAGERGHARHFSDLARDLDFFAREIERRFGFATRDTVFIGHSVAAVMLAQWVHDYNPAIRGMVLATPAFDVKLYVPFALPVLRLDRAIRSFRKSGPRYISSYVKGKLLTHDAREAQAYDSDPQICKQIAANVLLDLFDVARRLIADAAAINVPTLLVSARADWVVKNKPQRFFFDRLASKDKEVFVLKDFYHAVFHERERKLVFDRVKGFCEQAFSKEPERPSFRNADKVGFTAAEYEWLKAGLPMLSLKRFGFKIQAALMKSLGKASEGIRIGWEKGFDSGESLDHVYENVPKGSNDFGHIIDKIYLDSPGWRGIRQRKLHIEALLEEALNARALEKSPNSAAPLQLFDIAGGPARYLLDFLSREKKLQLRALIRDFSEAGLEQGRSLAARLRLSNVEFVCGDGLNEKSLEELPRESDLAIVSGLYELFSENNLVERSLQGIHAALGQGAYLIYTNQPWHPQLEMIAEVLTNRLGQPWIMRRRTQAEMDALVEAAGFLKVRTLVDEEGIFTVSLAKRV